MQSADLVVVGGGIHGCMVHFLAARSGLKSVLVEKDDFGGGASWSASRVLHGGIRYLQSGDLRRLRASVNARAWFFRSFPEFTSPLPCLMPLHGVGLRRRSVMRVAMRLHDLLSWDRNRGTPASHIVPPGRVLTPTETEGEFPLVGRDGLQGGSLWFDGLVRNPPRVLMELLKWTEACGGIAHNYAEATGVSSRDGRVVGVAVRDTMSGAEFEITTSRVVICTGLFDFHPPGSTPGKEVEIKYRQHSFNLLLNRALPSRCAVAVDTGRGRGQLLFLVPVGPITIAGTAHETVQSGDPTAPSEQRVERFLRDLNAAVPGWELARRDVVRALVGVVPLKTEGDLIDDHTNSGLPCGCLRVWSGKYTTAPTTGARVLKQLFGRDVFGYQGMPRPPLTRVLGAEEFLRLHEADPTAARDWVKGLWEKEQVKRVEDFVLRRMDWVVQPDFLNPARELVEKLVGS